ncbi:MAG TPA: phosphopantetheine-binding protein [Candidatus Limnocylindrales bacterium]|nr:phosphopantetheine-binding protein [Candidatus Limnocylindrales bacterium]
MANDEVLERVVEVVRFVAGAHRAPADLGPHTRIVEQGLELDSAAVLELMVSCEAAFSVTFDPATDFTEDALRTVATLAESVRRALARSR